jgi:hypothetical protein
MVKRDDMSLPAMDVSEAIATAEKLVKSFKSLTFNREALAQAIGSSTVNSGTFMRKLADLRKYGLIYGKMDELNVSEIAKTIAIPRNDDERKSAVRDIISNIPLYKALFEHFGNKIPTDDELLSFLLTKTDRVNANVISGKIKKAYIEALNYLSEMNPNEAAQYVENTSKIEKLEPSKSFLLKWETIDIKVGADDNEAIEAIIALIKSKLLKKKEDLSNAPSKTQMDENRS